MTDHRTQGYGLKWAYEDGSGELNPAWTATPDIPTIQRIAAEHLSLETSSVDAKFHAEGAFNKLYIVSPHSSSQQYLMRVALPVEPFFKTESEVALMGFLRKHTSLPVPKVVVYSSSADNDLRFEWALLEYIEGVPLADLWDGMSFSAKSDLSMQMLGHIKEMRRFEFSYFGNLYFSKLCDQVNGQPATWIRTSADNNKVGPDVESDPEFVIGRIVHPWFFRDKQIHLDADRGPYKSSCDLMLAKTDMQIERIRHLEPNPGDEYYSEIDEYLAKHEKVVLNTCSGLRDLVPDIFHQTEEQRLLYHHNLSDNNMILNPYTLELNGIVDWESVGICPSWKATKVPHFLKGIEVLEPPPIGTPGVDEESLVEIRKDWDRQCLRRIFSEDLPEAQMTRDTRRKLKFASLLEQIETRWPAARHWLPGLADPHSKEWEGRPLASWVFPTQEAAAAARAKQSELE
ncbi:phosphotransferase enzyme family-domain-containing protein [Aspergillus unguis]